MKNPNYTEAKRKTLEALDPFIRSGEISFYSLDSTEPRYNSELKLKESLKGTPIAEIVRKERNSH